MNAGVRWLSNALRWGRRESAKSPLLTTGLFVLGLLATVVLVDRVVSSVRADRASQAETLRRERDYRRLLLSRADRLARNLDRLETNWVHLRSLFFQDGTEDMAFAEIQKRLNELAGALKISVRSYRFSASRREGGLTVLPVNFDFTAPWTLVVLMLNAIEGSPKKLLISNCEIGALAGGESLVIQLTVNGYRYEEKK